jgi:hypothetical protein
MRTAANCGYLIQKVLSMYMCNISSISNLILLTVDACQISFYTLAEIVYPAERNLLQTYSIYEHY